MVTIPENSLASIARSFIRIKQYSQTSEEPRMLLLLDGLNYKKLSILKDDGYVIKNIPPLKMQKTGYLMLFNRAIAINGLIVRGLSNFEDICGRI